MGWLDWASGGKKKAADFVRSALDAKNKGDMAQVERDLEKGVELAEKEKDYDSWGVASYELGELRFNQGNKVAAEPHLRQAVQIFDDSEDAANLIKSLFAIGELYRQMHRITDAEQTFKYAVATTQQYVGAEHPDLAKASEQLAQCFSNKKQYLEAEGALSRSYKIHDGIDPASPDSTRVLSKLAVCLVEQSRFEEAAQLFQKNIAKLEKKNEQLSKEEAMTLCLCYHQLGRLLLQQSNHGDADAVFKKALLICDQYPGYLGEGDLVSDQQVSAGKA